MPTMVVYKEDGRLYMTNETNYERMIRNGLEVIPLKGFRTFAEVVSYMQRHMSISPDKFIDKTNNDGNN